MLATPDHGVTFYADSGRVFRSGKQARLTRQELMAFECLLDEYPRTLSRDRMNAVMYDHKSNAPESDMSGIWVHHLRKKLAPLGLAIENEWGYGYHLALDAKQGRTLRAAR